MFVPTHGIGELRFQEDNLPTLEISFSPCTTCLKIYFAYGDKKSIDLRRKGRIVFLQGIGN